MTTLLPAFAGCNTLYGAGMLELGMTFSLEQLVFDNDMIEMTKSAMRGIPVDELTLGVESIQKVGIGKNFLAHKQTRNYIDRVSDPKLINRDMFGDWEAAGSKDLATVAHEKVVDIMKNHEVTPIDADLMKDMKAVMDRADEDVRNAM
ncbi:MAG: trimethylamine:corrinoid methyltransferase [Methanohalophilus sp. T328-1]|jgi:trimethylamine--corrinoid protein Co-methyltransferase|nr:MAG: trimethylamine:corrinoid methyltransferase [Methanohalophilus sp. T328-1]OBZ34960.1 MAG: trimethylamine--corrinoid methyltransferase [Methanohalophilus sp. DAL1]ODV49905.1 MAG: trimethylamine:corrinoid methyltransferase [Methanohalophilus sp. 2-GBenrich]RSD33370.1 MAG: trimethylamine:corrinoid methyltransferase [Methanohalophilus sp.]SNY23021.1 trimethylamine---corrinoid protein Co-methyltransferase [Methanohalophilus euhalobius]